MIKRFIISIVCLTFIFNNLEFAHAQDFSVDQLPVPGTMVGESLPFAPLALKGLIVDPYKPLEFKFIVDTGNSPKEQLKQQSTQLVKYFLAGLTIPEEDLWVNLSPYEQSRMVPQVLGQTDLGHDLLAQDYILKQLTASLIYPEKDLGKAFWSRVYAKAQKEFGTTNVPVNTFNKVWILPDQAQVFENGSAAYVTKSTLKVMLDEDYLAMQKRGHVPREAGYVSPFFRQIILPEITKEVNTGKNFAPLRQIYQALILAKWYKETISNGLLDAVYTNKKKIAGVNVNDPAIKDEIYNRYLQAYKKGVFNYIKEENVSEALQSKEQGIFPRKYFSGGTSMAMTVEKTRNAAMLTPMRIAAGVFFLLAVSIGAAPVYHKTKEFLNYHVQQALIDQQIVSLQDNFSGDSQKAADDLVSDGESAVPSLVELLETGDNVTKARAASMLDRIGRPALPDILEAYNNTNDPAHKRQLGQLLSRLKDRAMTNLSQMGALDYEFLMRNNFKAYDAQAQKQFDPQQTDPRTVEKAIMNNNGKGESLFHHIQLSENAVIVPVYAQVQRIVKEIVGPNADILNMGLDQIHVTIANDEIAPVGKLILNLDQLAYDLTEDTNGVKPFILRLIGPHLMSNGSVVMEYITDAPEFLDLRKKAEERISKRHISKDSRASIPNIIHSTVCVIRDPKIGQDTLNKLRVRLDIYRHELAPIPVVVDKITATHFRENDRKFLESRDIPLGQSSSESAAMVNTPIPEQSTVLAAEAEIDFWELEGNVVKISAMLGHEDKRVILKAERALEKLLAIKEQMVDFYIKNLTTNWGDYVNVRLDAIEKLGDLGDKRAIKPLLEMFQYGDSENGKFRLNAEVALTKLGASKEQFADGYIKVLSSAYSEEEDLIYAAYKLGELKDPRAIKPLLQVMSSSLYKGVPYAAVKDILQIGGYEHKDVLQKLFDWYEQHRIDVQSNVFRFLDEVVQLKAEGRGFNIEFQPEISKYVQQENISESTDEKKINEYVTVEERPEVLRIIAIDNAMMPTSVHQDIASVAENGGIDLNQIKVNRMGKTIAVQFDPAQLSALEQGGFEGFSPVIESMTRISSPFPLLGVNVPKEEPRLVKA